MPQIQIKFAGRVWQSLATPDRAKVTGNKVEEDITKRSTRPCTPTAEDEMDKEQKGQEKKGTTRAWLGKPRGKKIKKKMKGSQKTKLKTSGKKNSSLKNETSSTEKKKPCCWGEELKTRGKKSRSNRVAKEPGRRSHNIEDTEPNQEESKVARISVGEEIRAFPKITREPRRSEGNGIAAGISNKLTGGHQKLVEKVRENRRPPLSA